MFKFVCFGRCQEKLLYQMLFDIEADVLQNPYGSTKDKFPLKYFIQRII